MALDLGELVAYLDLDSTRFDAAVDRMPASLSKRSAAFGAAGLVIGGVLMAAMAKGLTDAIDFDASLTAISAELSLTETESARIGANAGKVYAQAYGESVEDVQNAMGGVITQIEGMGSASDSVVNDMTAKVLNYASAFSVDTADAIAQVQQLMSSGLASSADEAMDLMTTAMQQVPEALRGDMSDAITEYGPLLADLGFSGQEAFDLLASGAERGMYGIDKAGDAVKEFGIRATDMSESSKSAYEALGMNQEEMTDRLLAGGDTAKRAFDEIIGGLQGIEDPAAQSQAALALFGTPLEDLGTSNIPTFLGSLSDLGAGFADSQGAADEMGAQMGSSVAVQMESLSRTVQMLFADLMTGLLPVLQAVFGFLAENPVVVQVIAAALGVLALSFIGVSVAAWALNTAILANPITWIIIGIVALIAALVLLVANWDAVVAWVEEVWGGFMTWIGEVVDGFVSWWNEVWAGFASWFSDLWDSIAQTVSDIVDGFFTWIGDAVDAVVTWIGENWGLLLSLFIGPIGLAIQWITENWGAITRWFEGILNGFVSFWSGIWNGIRSFFEGIWNGIISWAMSTISSFIAGWRAVWSALTGFFSGLWSGISSGISNAWNGIMSFFRGIPDTIMGFFSGIGSWLYSAGRDLINGLLNGISSLAGTIGSFFLNLLPGWIVGPFKAALGIASPSKLFEQYGVDTGSGYLRGVDKMQPQIDKRMGELVDTTSLDMRVSASAQHMASAGADVKGGAPVSTTFVYNAAENQSLSSEEALFAALGSPRAAIGAGS